MNIAKIKAIRDVRITRALWADARGAHSQADRNYEAAQRWDRVYVAAMAAEDRAEAAE